MTVPELALVATKVPDRDRGGARKVRPNAVGQDLCRGTEAEAGVRLVHRL